MLTEYYFAVRYGDIIILLYHEDMMSVRELLFKNSQKEKMQIMLKRNASSATAELLFHF